MTAEIVNLAVVRKMRGLLDDGTVVPFASFRTSPAARVGEAMAADWPPEPAPREITRITRYSHPDYKELYTLERGMAVRDRVTKRTLGIIWRFLPRPGQPGSVANVVVQQGLAPSRLYAPEAIEPIPGADIDPPPAA